MYKMYLDDELMYCPSLQNLSLEAVSINMELNATNVCNFSIMPMNPCYGMIKKRKSIVKIYDDDYRLFRGIVLDSKRGFQNGLLVNCEGELAFFRDSIQRPYEFKGSVEEYFAFLISEHNRQIDANRQFKIGRCTVTVPNDYIEREDSQYLNTWESLQKKLIEILGGYLWTREEEDGVYIDYLKDFDTINSQSVEFGKNLLNFDEAIKGANIATAIIPLGGRMQDEEGKDTGKRLTIADINDGVDYVFEAAAVEKYGLIFKTVIFDDVILPENLMRKGREELQNYINLSQSIEVSAVNLHNANRDIRSFRIGNYTKVISKPHDLNEVMLTRKLDIDLLDPTSGVLYPGDERKTFIDKQHDNNKHAIETIERVEKEYELNKEQVQTKIKDSQKLVVSDIEPEDKERLWCDTSEEPPLIKQWNGAQWIVVNNQEDAIAGIYNEISSQIQQLHNNIMIEVGKTTYLKGDINDIVEEVKTQFSQDENGFSFDFKSLKKDVDNNKNSADAKFEEINKYIRFIDGAIVIGEVGKPLTLKMKNDRISFLENNSEVAYISNRRIYFTDAEVLNSLTIGRFAWVEGSAGHLTLRKVK